MTEWVLDASAVLAYLQREAGWERVEAVLLGQRCLLSSVNLAEVLSRLADWGVPIAAAQTRILAMDIQVLAYDHAQPRLTAELRPLTRALGLSLGDRACLALAQARGAVALTADRAWTRLAPDCRVQVECVRPDTPGG